MEAVFSHPGSRGPLRYCWRDNQSLRWFRRQARRAALRASLTRLRRVTRSLRSQKKIIITSGTQGIFSRKLTAKFVPYNRKVPIFSRKSTAKFVPYNRTVPIFSRKLTAKFVPYTVGRYPYLAVN